MLKKIFVTVAAVLVTVLSQTAAAATLEFAQVVAETSALAAMKPAAQQVTISAAGNYTLTLTDLGKSSGNGTAFNSLVVVVYQGSNLIKSLALPTGTTTASTNLANVAKGSYQVQVLGTTSGGSQYGVELQDTSGATVWQNAGSINASSSDNFALQRTVLVKPGQSYTITVTDRQFPAALSAQAFTITSGSSTLGDCNKLGAGTCTFTASGSSVLLSVLSSTDSGGMGLYSVRIGNSSGAVYADTVPVGSLHLMRSITLPASAGYTLTTTDLATPQALTTLATAVVQGANAATLTGSGSVAFTGTAGTAQLYVVAQAASGSAGLYGLSVRSGSTIAHESVEAVNPPLSGNPVAHQWNVALPAAGNYTIHVEDFAVPAALANMQWTVSQNGSTLQTKSGSGELAVSAAAGNVLVSVVGGTVGNNVDAALLGITIRNSAGTSIYASTQGVGEQMVTTQLPLVAGKYAVLANDFSVPVALQNLIAVVTQGAELVGRVDANGGSASVPFTVTTAGDYAVSLFAAPMSSGSYGMFGVGLSGEPAVSLSVSAASITSGQTVMLTWSSTDAHSCTASGGWSGSQPTTGSLTTSPLTSSTTFVLTCQGPAGTAAKTVQVNVNGDTGSGGGGGAWSWGALLMLLSISQLRRRSWDAA